jgi:4-carboxymuconolactone decarboxylase
LSANQESQSLFDDGLQVRREVLGTAYVDAALDHSDDLTKEFQEFVTTYCWGDIWTDDRLSRRERSLLVLGMTAALGRFGEVEAHALGGMRNGLTKTEMAAILRQIAVYCGVPTGVSTQKAFRNAIGKFDSSESH